MGCRSAANRRVVLAEPANDTARENHGDVRGQG
jgi:hypothetical protein